MQASKSAKYLSYLLIINHLPAVILDSWYFLEVGLCSLLLSSSLL